jgi:hypothetical protein
MSDLVVVAYFFLLQVGESPRPPCAGGSTNALFLSERVEQGYAHTDVGGGRHSENSGS